MQIMFSITVLETKDTNQRESQKIKITQKCVSKKYNVVNDFLTRYISYQDKKRETNPAALYQGTNQAKSSIVCFCVK